MTDCPNADVRDLLPGFLHDRLVPNDAECVRSHLASCDDCRAELALLADARAVMRVAPAIDFAAVAAAVPAYRAPAGRSWVGWRVAASITVLVAGGSSLLVMQNAAVRPDSVASVSITPARTVPVVDPAIAPATGGTVAVRPMAVTPPVALPSAPSRISPTIERQSPTAASPEARASRELAMGGGALGDLSDRELASLLKDIESMDGVPSADIETPAMSPIAPRNGRRSAP